jgi:uncharacterized protein (TIGR00645 family)
LQAAWVWLHDGGTDTLVLTWYSALAAPYLTADSLSGLGRVIANDAFQTAQPQGAMSNPNPSPESSPKSGILDTLERLLEGCLFASRWLLAPLFLGLAFALVVLLLKFMQAVWHIAATAIWATEVDVILGVLSLVDLVLMGSLIIIVIFSGYENFVSKIDHSKHRDWPEWMGTIDFTALKLKLLSSIVAISGIHLLKKFMDVSKIPDRDLFWYALIHGVFVLSMLLLALSDRISGHSQKPAVHPKANGQLPDDH